MATAPTVAIPTPAPATYSEFYADASNDPYNGHYGPSMRTFRNLQSAPTANQAFEIAKSVSLSTPNAYVGMYAHTGEECGRTLVAHGLQVFPTVLGRPTP